MYLLCLRLRLCMLGTEIIPSIDGRQRNLAIHYPDIGRGRRSVNIFFLETMNSLLFRNVVRLNF